MNVIQKLTWSELEILLKAGNFTEDEETIIGLLNRGESITGIAMKTSLSEPTVSRRIKGIKDKMKRINEIPIWEKTCLSIEEASEYSNIGTTRLRKMLNDPYCEFAIKVGGKTLVKRKMFENYLEKSTEI